MKLFRLRNKRGKEEPEKELVLDTEAEASAGPPPVAVAEAREAPDVTPEDEPEEETGASPLFAAEPEAEGPGEAPEQGAAGDRGAQDSLFAEISAEQENEASGEDGNSEEDEELDPELLDLFRDARNEVEESSLAAQLEEVPIHDLRSEVADISQRLGISARPAAVAETVAESGGAPESEPEPPDGPEGAVRPDPRD